MLDYFNPFMPSGNERLYILNQTQRFLDAFCPPGTKGLRELNICETKNCEIKVCGIDLEK